MRKLIKNLPSCFFLLLVSLLAFLFLKNILSLTEEINSLYFQAAIPQIFSQEKKLATLVLVGDIMLDRGVEWMIKKEGNNDWKFPFLKIAQETGKADILFGNLEGPISDKGQKIGSIYSFRMDPRVIEGLTFAGFDVLSLANNHILDYTSLAMEDTFSRLQEVGISYVGAGFNEIRAYSPLIKEIKGMKIAFLAFTDLGSVSWEARGERSGIALFSKEKLENSIKKAKNESDLVVVSFHFGDEYKFSPTEEQKEMAEFAIDSGADLVIGHHPHVIEPVEEYKGKYIAYSLGNFVFDQSFSEETMKGLMLKVTVEDGAITYVIPIEFKINQYFQPEITMAQND